MRNHPTQEQHLSQSYLEKQ